MDHNNILNMQQSEQSIKIVNSIEDVDLNVIFFNKKIETAENKKSSI